MSSPSRCRRAPSFPTVPGILVLALLASGWTSRAWSGAPTTRPAGVRYVYLVRHGFYDRDDTVPDETGNGLNPLGHEQARLTGERLKALHLRIGRLVGSNYTRARETAADLGAILSRAPAEDSLLHECTPRAARADYLKDLSAAEITACESNLVKAWDRYMSPSPDSTVCDVLVCHGNVIRWFVMRAIGADPVRWSSLDVANGSITVISVAADGATRLAVFSDASHIPPEKQTWTGRGPGWTARPR